jgi:hypothetical protein
MKNILDIHQLETLEIDNEKLASIKKEAKHYGSERYGWERLVNSLK